MKIQVFYSVLTGNMGDGWKSQEEAAYGYASLLEQLLDADIKADYPAAEIEITIEVQRASGYSRDLSVEVIDGGDDEFDIANRLEEFLPYTIQEAWEKFCEKGKEYFEE